MMVNEKWLIDANTLIKQLWAHNAMEPGLTAEIEHCPTVDAVEVVRCKDCEFWSDGWFPECTMGKCRRGKNGSDRVIPLLQLWCQKNGHPCHY